MEDHLPDVKELDYKMANFYDGYHLVGAKKDREAFYALTPEELKEHPLTICGVFVNLVMDGRLEEAEDLINLFEKNSFLYLALSLVHPKITLKRFAEIINYLKENNIQIHSIVLNAGRPYLLNGFYDFTRLGIFLEKNRELFVEDLKYMYEPSCCPHIYNLCLAEYYYQLNRTLDAQVLISRTIKEFDKASESRLLFVALFLQSKILLSQGKIVAAGSYIKDIRKFVKKNGEMEFSYNIDAAEAMSALYEGDLAFVTKWQDKKAPDEFAEFNMLDLYRYMVKIRCYIINKKYTAVISLSEKLRTLLESGMRHMDLCELDLLLAICFYRSGEKKLAFETLERALKIARRYKYYRLVADEGTALLPLLIEYIKENGSTNFLLNLAEMTREMAIQHPLYLKAIYKNAVKFSPMEVGILKLLEQGKTNEDISSYYFITNNTVKYHLKRIYKKLKVNAAHQAVWEARISGVI